MNPRGSEWRKWDLHIHSPLSILNNQFPQLQDGTGPDWESYLQKLEQSSLAVVGVTDYFTIDGYRALKGHQASGRLTGIRLLPNVEFRLNSIVTRRGQADRRLNLHVIFSDEVPAQDIEEHFLHDLDFFFEGNPQQADQRRKLKRSNIEALGERLKGEEPTLQGSAALVGAARAVVSHEQITDILANDSRFKGKYLVVIAEEDWNLIEWTAEGGVVRKGLLQKADLMFSGKPKTIEWCLGQGPHGLGEDQFVREFKSLKACIHGSDAHDLATIGVPCAKRGDQTHQCGAADQACDLRHCWIKADPTFEGLRQLVFEPLERVRIQELSPAAPKSQYSLDGVAFGPEKVNEELTITKTDLPLNEGLVAVTGGKGSGKTALLDLIAHCFSDRSGQDDPNSFVHRISEEAPELGLSIRFKAGVEFEKRLADGRFFEDSAPVYIAQGELERHISDRDDLAKYIRTLIFESAEIKDSKIAFDFGEADESLRKTAEALELEQEIIVRLEMTTSPVEREKLRLHQKRTDAEVKDLEGRIAEVQRHLSPEKIKEGEERQGAVQKLQHARDELTRVRASLDVLKTHLGTVLPQLQAEIARSNEGLKKVGIDVVLPTVEYPGLDLVKQARAAAEERLADTLVRLEKETKESSVLAEELRQHASLLAKVGELKTSQEEHREAAAQMDRTAQELAAVQDRRHQLHGELLKATLDQQQKYREIIEMFSKGKAEVLSDLAFVPRIEFDKDRLLQGVESILDNRQVDLPEVCGGLVAAYRAVASGDGAKVSDVLAETERLAAELPSKMKKSQAFTTRELYRVLWGSYLRVVPVVTYKKVGLDRLSLGQKATVLVKIYLAHGTNPIIIDSHDEHMDNEFIMDELVGAIRKAKTYRQVILASNNGNVVVNSDAEQVIIASHQAGQVSYVSGSLEDPTIRDRALKVLEGGAEAFRKRQSKYRMSA